METRVEIFLKKGINDSKGEGIKTDIGDLGIRKVKEVKTAQIYLLEGKISSGQKKKISENLLVDPLLQKYILYPYLPPHPSSGKIGNISSSPSAGMIEEGGRCWIVEVWPKKGVTDTVAESTEKGIRDLGIKAVKKVRTGKKYLISGSLSSKEIETISQRLLANKIIENYSIRKNA